MTMPELPAFKLILAPMRGLTEYPFRTVLAKHTQAVDAALAPFISTTRASRIKPAYFNDVLAANNTPTLPLTPQLLSNNAQDFIVMAKGLHGLGYGVVNWNLGCPFPQVANKKRGSGLLPYTDEIASFLDEVIPAIPNRLSIKLRLGSKTVDELFRLLPVLNSYPLHEVILHPRLGSQMYDGVADLDMFIAAAKEIKHRLVYNGDIVSRETFAQIRAKLPAMQSFMLGRGLIGNPFLGDILRGKDDTSQELQARFMAFYDDLYLACQQRLRTPKHLMDKMKGYWNYFGLNFATNPKDLKKILRAQNLESFNYYVSTALSGRCP